MGKAGEVEVHGRSVWASRTIRSGVFVGYEESLGIHLLLKEEKLSRHVLIGSLVQKPTFVCKAQAGLEFFIQSSVGCIVSVKLHLKCPG